MSVCCKFKKSGSAPEPYLVSRMGLLYLPILNYTACCDSGTCLLATCRGLLCESEMVKSGTYLLVERLKAVVTIAFNCDSTAVRLPFNCSSTALRPFDDIYYDCEELLYCRSIRLRLDCRLKVIKVIEVTLTQPATHSHAYLFIIIKKST